MNYILEFFSFRQLFDFGPAPISGAGSFILLTLFLILLLISVILFKISKKKDKDRAKAIKKTAVWLVYLCFVLIIYWFFAYEGVMYLSAKIFLLIWGLALLFVIYKSIVVIFVKIPKIQRGREEKRNFEKYIQ